MITKMQKKKKNLKIAILSLILIVSSFLSILPAFNINSENLSEFESEDKVVEVEPPFLSTLGDDQWWNKSFTYRKLINITNPYDEAFTNFIANVTFNYTNLVSQGNMNQSLKDIRIIENGELRNYYIETDFPKKDLATVWFETDISAGPDHLDQDTYMYYGNNNVSFASNYLMDNNPDGLIWYKFEEVISNEVVDSMKNYNATVNGAVQSADSALGSYALSFDGSNDYLAIQDKHYSAQNEIPELTVCVWFKTSQSGGSYSSNWAFFDFDRSENYNFYIRPNGGRLGFSSTAYGWDETTNQWEYDTSDDNYDDFYGSTTGLNDGLNWHFGCALYNGLDKVLYTDDGVEDARNDYAHSGYAIGRGRYNRYGIIGDGSEATSEGTPRNNIYYNGLLDEIRYFEESLSPKRIEWLAKKFIKLDTNLNEEQEKKATITITAKDIDGRVVPGLEILMFNKTQESYNDTTGQLGYVEFPDVNRSLYSIIANYSITNGTHTFEKVVFNSSTHNIVYDFTGGDVFTVYINVSLWSIDFEIKDWNKEPMGYGYVLVYNKSDYTDLIANLTLNKELGTTTFRWINTSNDAAYYYEVYYNNEDYVQPRPLLKTGTVDRATYLTNNLNNIPIIEVNKTNKHEIQQKYLVEEKVYATGSNETHIGNTKIINATIVMSNMVETLDEISIHYIDVNNTVSSDPIFSQTYTSQTDETINLNVTEFVEAYGLLIYVEGTNTSVVCHGTIDIDYSETCNQYVQVNMSKLIIKVYDTDGIWKSEYGSVRVKVINGTSGDGITTLITNDQGIAKGDVNSDLDFWYIRNTLYNFTLEYGGAPREFNVSSDQYTTPLTVWLDHFNYTLYKNATIEFRIRTSMADFATKFDKIYWDPSNEWGKDFTFRVQFMSTDNFTDPIPLWNPVTFADFVDWEITDLLGDLSFDSGAMNSELDGYFNYTINSGFLIGGEQYYFKIYGEKKGYQNPAPVQLLFEVTGKNTSIGVYDTSDLTNLGNNVTQYYGETLDLTIFYSSGGTLLEGAIVSYEWQFIDTPIVINENPAGYYSFIINTTIADVGTYQIKINAELQNYSSFQNYRFDITVIHRPTSLNGDTSLHHISKTLWVRQDYNFTFEYKDILSDPHISLTDLDEVYYQWYEVSANGTIIGSISEKIDLIEGPNSIYILDFETALREVGDYAIFVTLQKNNYEVRTALIDLTIKKRLITWDLTATNLVQSQIKIVQGEEVYIELTLQDLSDPTDPQPITGATVVLRLGSLEYELSETENGTYIYTFTTGNINTFIAARVFTGEISITREDYVSESIPITVIVGMTEIFPGMPMFYFLLIVVGIVAVVGSLTIYRLVQQARIPTFVKKARKMKKEIKGKKAISESLLYPSKEEYLIKQLGDKWEMLGLSLRDVLGFEIKKKKTMPEVKEEVKFKEPTGGEE